jgi:hypothetical protein
MAAAWGILVGLGMAAAGAAPATAEDIYVAASAANNGTGSASSPYRRITDAVLRARGDRQSAVIPLSETIVIHVAAGTYAGSFTNSNKHVEMLPIVINVPNVVLQGATALAVDSSGLPIGVANNGPESTIVSNDNPKDLSAALVTVTHTTDGGAGNGVTIRGFSFSGIKGLMGIIVDHVTNFAITGNYMYGSYSNIYTRAAIGSVTGNLLINANTAGFLGEGGTVLFPSRVSIYGNEINNDGEIGVVGVDYPADLTLNLGLSGLTALPYNFGGSSPDLPSGMTLLVTDNDISQNKLGVRLFVAPFVPNANAVLGPGMPTLSATIIDNSIVKNHQYGLDVDGGDAPTGFAPYSGSVFVTLLANLFKGNEAQPALFTFYNFFDTIGGTLEQGFLQQATYDIVDLDGELTSFDYDNPTIDTTSGAPLNNTLTVNGSQNILGFKLTPKP